MTIAYNLSKNGLYGLYSIISDILCNKITVIYNFITSNNHNVYFYLHHIFIYSANKLSTSMPINYITDIVLY